MVRASFAISLVLLASCSRESEQHAQVAAEAPAPDSESEISSDELAASVSTAFFVGRWASEEANCRDASWLITAEELRTPGEVTCCFQRVTHTERGADAEATCYAEGPPEQWTLRFAYAQSARALLIENAPFNDVGLVRCGDAKHAADADEVSAKGARGAADVVRHYYELLGAARFDDASQLWTPGERARALQSAEQNVAQYASYEVEVGEPGRIEGAAGSLYISIPITIDAMRKDGADVHLSGEATLRRSNDVPGATPEQLSWRIVGIEVQSAGIGSSG